MDIPAVAAAVPVDYYLLLLLLKSVLAIILLQLAEAVLVDHIILALKVLMELILH